MYIVFVYVVFFNHHYADACSFLFVDPRVVLQLGRSLMQQACDHGYFQRDPCCCLVQRNSLGKK